MNPLTVIDESRPMLREFLCDIGFCRETDTLELSQLLGPFSDWIECQTVQDEDRFYLASRIGAFICEYMLDAGLAERLIVDNRIVIRLPITTKVQREFDPYPVALGIADKQTNLQQFINAVSTQIR
jgi:hypothetical protein